MAPSTNGTREARKSKATNAPHETSSASAWGDPRFVRDLEQLTTELADLRARADGAPIERDGGSAADDAAWLAARTKERRADPHSLTRERAEDLARALQRIATATEIRPEDAAFVSDAWKSYRGGITIDGWADVYRLLGSLVPDPTQATPFRVDEIAGALASAWLYHCGARSADVHAPLSEWKAAAVAWRDRAARETKRQSTRGRLPAANGEEWTASFRRLCAALEVDLPTNWVKMSSVMRGKNRRK